MFKFLDQWSRQRTAIITTVEPYYFPIIYNHNTKEAFMYINCHCQGLKNETPQFRHCLNWVDIVTWFYNNLTEISGGLVILLIVLT